MSLKYYAFAILVVLFVYSYDAAAQPGRRGSVTGGSVSGTVVDSVSGKPIVYATVSLIRAADSALVTGAISRDEGNFTVDKVPYGQYILKATFLGYDKHFISGIAVTPENKNVKLGTFGIYPAAIESEGVEVTADRDFVTYSIDKKVVDVSKNLAARGGTAADALKNVPSVRVDIEGNVLLRGSANFTVLIDGKPTVLAPNDVLKQIPAAAIENIEIITNPSAKYDPDGTAGILNIIMKKQSMEGVNGLANATIGTRDKYNGSLLVNYRNSGYNAFVGGDYNNQRYHPVSDFVRETYSGDTTYYASPFMDRMFNPNSYIFKAGIDYFLNETNTVSLSGNYGYYGYDRYFPSDYTQWTQPETERTYFRSVDNFIVGGNYFSSTLNYHLKLPGEGHEFISSLISSGWYGDVDQDTRSITTDENFKSTGEVLRQNRTFNDINRTNLRYKADYTLPFTEESKLEAGYQSDFTWKSYDYLYEDYDIPSGDWSNNPEFTNNMDYAQSVHSVYATYSNSLIGINYQLGLRGEYYYRNLQQLTIDKDYQFDQFSIFPTVHLTKHLTEAQQLQLSYSRRVRRPDDRTLNPFPDYTDDFYISMGNPELKPQFTNSFELNYRLGLDRSFISLETYYRQSDDVISRVLRLREDNRILITSDNENSEYALGGELALNLNLVQCMRLNLSSNIYKYHLEETSGGQNENRSRWTFDANGALTLILGPGTFIQLNGYYNGPRIITDGEQKEVFTTSLSIRQDLFNRSLSVILSGRDIFKTAKYDFTQSGLNFKSTGYFEPESPAFSLTLSFRINNYRPTRRDRSDQPDIDFQGGF